MVIRLTLMLLITGALFFSASSKAVVEVTINKIVYTYPTNPRLSDVLNPVARQEQWYWPESKIFRSDTTHSQEFRKQIIEKLSIESNENERYKSTYQNIIKQIKSWELADRVPIKIDFELARISPIHNPRLEDGQFRIILSKRPTNLYVFGAVNNAFILPYNNNTCIEDIVSEITVSNYADKSYVYLISPQGKIEKSPIAYWNSQCTLPIPGYSLYVPLQESPFSQLHKIINTQILTLAVNRISAQ